MGRALFTRSCPGRLTLVRCPCDSPASHTATRRVGAFSDFGSTEEIFLESTRIT
jgi:hypothetical protein